nr:hypothetical protein CFP56_72637 [Quercus suber]
MSICADLVRTCCREAHSLCLPTRRRSASILSVLCRRRSYMLSRTLAPLTNTTLISVCAVRSVPTAFVHVVTRHTRPTYRYNVDRCLHCPFRADCVRTCRCEAHSPRSSIRCRFVSTLIVLGQPRSCTVLQGTLAPLCSVLCNVMLDSLSIQRQGYDPSVVPPHFDLTRSLSSEVNFAKMQPNNESIQRDPVPRTNVKNAD